MIVFACYEFFCDVIIALAFDFVNIQNVWVEGKKGKKAKENHSKIKPTILSSTEVIAADSPVRVANPKPTANPKLPPNLIPKSIFNSLQSKDNLGSDEELDSEDYDHGDDYDDDEEDEGTIHQILPNVNPNTLLHSLTQKENEKNEQTSRKAEKTTANKHYTDLTIERLDGDTSLKSLIPGPPRDLIGQLVNRYVQLSWMEPAKNPDEVISYTVFYKMSTSERWVQLQLKVHPSPYQNVTLPKCYLT